MFRVTVSLGNASRTSGISKLSNLGQLLLFTWDNLHIIPEKVGKTLIKIKKSISAQDKAINHHLSPPSNSYVMQAVSNYILKEKSSCDHTLRPS